MEALATPYEGSPPKHVLLFSISRHLALLLKQASNVSYFQTTLLPAMFGEVESKNGTIFSAKAFRHIFKNILRNLPKFSSLAPPVLAEKYRMFFICEVVMSNHSRVRMIDIMADF